MSGTIDAGSSASTNNMADDLHHEEKKAKKRKEKRIDEGASATPKEESIPSKRKKSNASEHAPIANKEEKVSADQNGTSSNEAVPVWSLELDGKLLETIETVISDGVSTNKTSKGIFIKAINWDKVSKAFEDMTKEQVHSRWNFLSSKVRKTRTAEEILKDVQYLHDKRMTNPPESTKKPASKKSGVDPDLPKKPMTSFFLFIKEKRPRLHEKYPELSNTELTKKLGKKWQELPEEKKQKYNQRYKSGQEIYSEELTQYLSKHFPDEKPPSTAFEKWRVEVENEIKKERPEISEKKLNKKLIRRWEKLEESEKSLLEKRARNKLSSFHAKLLKKVKYPME